MSRKAYRIKLCWGLEKGECPNLLQNDPDLKHDLESVLEASGWPECLLDNLQREIKPLDQFSISISGCPNGCSRPQIADLGLLQAQVPQVQHKLCTGCGECAAACREGAIDVQSGVAEIDPKWCLWCGVCVRFCPEGAIFPRQQGYRVQVGGKLGRHPRLADELPGIRFRSQVLDILAGCLQLQQRFYRPGLRFGQLIAELGSGRIGEG
ncbi:MAG: 4Fe-4S dicluster domain-containing protein [Desulfohalobiaceae bacterium]